MSFYIPDMIRFVALIASGSALFWLVDIAFAHRRSPRKRLSNPIVWCMALGYALLALIVSSHVIDNFGEPLRPDAPMLLGSVILVAIFLYRLTGEFHHG